MIAICLLVSAFFSGMEIAFLTANRLRVELRSKQGIYSAKLLAKYFKKPSDFISTVLVANNIALVVYGIFAGDLLHTAFTNWGLIFYSETLKLLVITFLSTAVVLVTAEFIPKSLFRINPDSLLNTFILPFRLVHLILWPIIISVKKISSFFLKYLTGTPITDNTPVFSKVDLDNYISAIEHAGNPENTEIDTEIFKNALEFSESRLRDFMVPRTEIVAIDFENNVENLTQLFIESAHSKVLVYRDNIDNIIGFVHHSEMFSSPNQISSVLKPVLIVNESMQAMDLLREFIQKRRSVAVVVDEFGGTAGMVTIEDIIEEIFGEIEDEFDIEALQEKILEQNRFLFSARLEIYYLNDKYGLGIPEGDYSTLGGYIISICEKIPQIKEVIHHGRFEFIIIKGNNSRIEEVELFLHDEE